MADRWEYNISDIISLRGAVAQINVAHVHIYLRFQYCLHETILLYKGAPACFFVNCELTL